MSRPCRGAIGLVIPFGSPWFHFPARHTFSGFASSLSSILTEEIMKCQKSECMVGTLMARTICKYRRNPSLRKLSFHSPQKLGTVGSTSRFGPCLSRVRCCGCRYATHSVTDRLLCWVMFNFSPRGASWCIVP